jgi:hypothetical protein
LRGRFGANSASAAGGSATSGCNHYYADSHASGADCSRNRSTTFVEGRKSSDHYGFRQAQAAAEAQRAGRKTRCDRDVAGRTITADALPDRGAEYRRRCRSCADHGKLDDGVG